MTVLCLTQAQVAPATTPATGFRPLGLGSRTRPRSAPSRRGAGGGLPHSRARAPAASSSSSAGSSSMAPGGPMADVGRLPPCASLAGPRLTLLARRLPTDGHPEAGALRRGENARPAPAPYLCEAARPGPRQPGLKSSPRIAKGPKGSVPACLLFRTWRFSESEGPRVRGLSWDPARATPGLSSGQACPPGASEGGASGLGA